MSLLENPTENPCFGCGPAHPRGLRLTFERRRGDVEGADEVVTTCEPRDDEVGWPGLFHTGLHFATLFEVSYWAAWELTGTVHTAHGPQTFDQTRLPRTGRRFVASARLVDTEPGRIGTRATSRTEDGRDLATLDVSWRPEKRGIVARAGLDLPPYLMAGMEE